MIGKIDAIVSNLKPPTTIEDAKHHKALRKTVELMKVHPPDTAWLIRWLGVMNPADEIFHKSYKYKRPKIEVDSSSEEEFCLNNDNFFTDLPILDDKTIRTTNRIRVPKKVMLKRRIKQARATAERARVREEHLIAYRETISSDSDSELHWESEA